MQLDEDHALPDTQGMTRLANIANALENPVTGERITFLQSGQDTNGELFRMRFQLRPHGFVPNAHIHPRQEERFEVVSGTLHGRVGRRRVRLNAGEALAVPVGVSHTWWNDSDTEVDAIIEFRPALNSEAMFRAVWGLAAQGKVTRHGRPHLLQLAVLLDEYKHELAPPLVTRPVFALLARLGKLLVVGSR